MQAALLVTISSEGDAKYKITQFAWKIIHDSSSSERYTWIILSYSFTLTNSTNGWGPSTHHIQDDLGTPKGKTFPRSWQSN